MITIVDAVVEDPRARGEYVNPYVRIFVDEDVIETGDPVYSADKMYRTIPCGPFKAIENPVIDGFNETNWSTSIVEPMTVGEFNTLRLTSDQMFPVMVSIPTEPDDVPLYMAVTRLRRLLRKHTGRGSKSWYMAVDEVEAIRGNLSWRLVQRDAKCFHCDQIGASEVVHNGATINMCNVHLNLHNLKISELRRATNLR